MATPFFYGSQATIEFGAAIVDPLVATNTLDGLFTSTNDISAEVKEMSLALNGPEIEILNVFGDQLKEEQRPEFVTLEVTAVFKDVDTLSAEFGFDTTTLTTPADGFTPRFTGIDAGDTSRVIEGNANARAVLIRMTEGTTGGATETERTVNILLNNAALLGAGEISLAADGSAEWTGTWVAKFTDFHIEDNIT